MYVLVTRTPFWCSLANGVSDLYGERGKGSKFTEGSILEMLTSDRCVSSSYSLEPNSSWELSMLV
jgi:hypothetical protein